MLLIVNVRVIRGLSIFILDEHPYADALKQAN